MKTRRQVLSHPLPSIPSQSTPTDHVGQWRKNRRLALHLLPFERRWQTHCAIGRKRELHNLHFGKFAEPTTIFNCLNALFKLRLQVEGKVFSFSKKFQGKNHNLFFLLYIENSNFPRNTTETKGIEVIISCKARIQNKTSLIRVLCSLTRRYCSYPHQWGQSLPQLGKYHHFHEKFFLKLKQKTHIAFTSSKNEL